MQPIVYTRLLDLIRVSISVRHDMLTTIHSYDQLLKNLTVAATVSPPNVNQ